MFKVNTEGSAVSICDFEHVNICIYNVTKSLTKYQIAQSFGNSIFNILITVFVVQMRFGVFGKTLTL